MKQTNSKSKTTKPFNIDEVLKEIDSIKIPLHERVIDYFKDIWLNITSFFTGLKNFWYFRKEIYQWRWWDYGFTLDILEKTLELQIPRYQKESISVEGPKIAKLLEELLKETKVLNTSGYDITNPKLYEKSKERFGELMKRIDEVWD